VDAVIFVATLSDYDQRSSILHHHGAPPWTDEELEQFGAVSGTIQHHFCGAKTLPATTKAPWYSSMEEQLLAEEEAPLFSENDSMLTPKNMWMPSFSLPRYQMTE
jgi:hypothetical protein